MRWRNGLNFLINFMTIQGKEHLKKFDEEHPCDERGNWSRYFNTKESIEKLGLKYKDGVGIKVLLEEMASGPVLKSFYIEEYCIIHSYFANKGIAPKIYNFGKVHGYDYIEVEDVTNKKNSINATGDFVVKVSESSEFIIPHMIEFKHPEGKNFLNGYYLDFHGFKIDKEKFERWFKGKIKDSHWGNKKNGEKYSYQGNIIVDGKRNIDQRVQEMKLCFCDFKGKTVLDVGCNLGMMSLWARDNGASKVVGVECFHNFKLLADIYKFYTGTSNVEFIEEEIVPKEIDKFGKFDIVFYFAVEASLGIPDKLRDITKELLIYEGHNTENQRRIELRLSELFTLVELVGYTTDRSKRPIFYCYK